MTERPQSDRRLSHVATLALSLALPLSLALWPIPGRADTAPPPQAQGQADDHDEDGGIALSPQAIQEAGIQITPVQPRPVAQILRIPGEVVANKYRSGVVTPRIAGIVSERLVSVGDKVRKGQTLAVMTSVEMAAAQGDYQIAEQEWRRVRQLGRDIVSDKRFNETDIQRRQAMSRLLGFGMTPRDIAVLGEQGAGTAGRFSLTAPQDGTVHSDDFVLGELIEPGRVLFTIADGNSLWVDARINPVDAKAARKGMDATVHTVDGSYAAIVSATNPIMDEATRTVSIRLETDNHDGRLRPGMFVDVDLKTDNQTPALAVPTDSVLRGPDGDWFVYTPTESGAFVPVEIKVVRTANGLTVIDGLRPGQKVVTAGAFFIQSEAMKSSLGADHH